MVKKTVFGEIKCSVCGAIYEKEDDAISCEDSHNIIYVPFKREDLFRLVQFLYTGNKDLLTNSLVETLLKYRKGAY